MKGFSIFDALASTIILSIIINISLFLLTNRNISVEKFSKKIEKQLLLNHESNLYLLDEPANGNHLVVNKNSILNEIKLNQKLINEIKNKLDNNYYLLSYYDNDNCYLLREICLKETE